MTRDKIRNAVAEARRFLKAAEAALKDMDDGDLVITGTKATGAARRASMDLTRALSSMRSSSVLNE